MKQYGILICITFALHFIWEYFHVPLYGGYEELGSGLPLTIWASIGDVAYTLGVALLFALIKDSFQWMQRASMQDFAALAAVGLFIAVFVEYKAFVFEKWFYLEAMPIIPILEVGLSPILQMALLLPLSVFLTRFVLSYTQKKI